MLQLYCFVLPFLLLQDYDCKNSNRFSPNSFYTDTDINSVLNKSGFTSDVSLKLIKSTIYTTLPLTGSIPRINPKFRRKNIIPPTSLNQECATTVRSPVAADNKVVLLFIIIESLKIITIILSSPFLSLLLSRPVKHIHCS